MALNLFYNNLAEDESMGANVTSASQKLESVDGFAMQFTWDSGSSPVGDFTVEVSNDDINYVTLSGSSYTVGTDSGSHIVSVAHAPYQYARGKYTFVSGDANLNITINGKIY